MAPCLFERLRIFICVQNIVLKILFIEIIWNLLWF